MKHHALFEASPNPYMVLDRDLRVVAANAEYLRVTASTLEDILGRNIFEAFPHDPDNPDNESVRIVRESFERARDTGRRDVLAVVRYRIPRHGPDGVVLEERLWSATQTPIFDERGEVAYVLQHTVEVTELERLREVAREAGHGAATCQQIEQGVLVRARRVQAENVTLDAERRHLLRLFEQAPGFIAVLRGPRHVFELSNAAYQQLVGHREITGRAMLDALPELAGQGYAELLDRVRETGEPFVGRASRVRLQRAPGAPLEERILDFVYQPVFEADGEISGIFVQGHDRTEEHRAREEVVRYRDHLEELVLERTRALEESEAERARAEAALRQSQKMEAVGNLTGGVAHDFNNLLQVIGNNLQLLADDVGTETRAARRVQSALGAVQRGGKLASQLLAFARRQPLEPSVVGLARLAKDMDEMIRRTVGGAIELETSVANDVWAAFADRNQLENVLLNLAINARDAMSGRGKLTITAANAMLDARSAGGQLDVAPGEYVSIAVSDDGCGMSKEVLERALEPFFTTKGEGRGTGLGLSMVYGFVKQSGGHLDIQSEPGCGTTVTIYLPRSLAEEEVLSEAIEGPVVGGTETILVVEDDPAVRDTVVEVLSGLGYRVVRAADGERALVILESGIPIDLVFTDVVMPGPVRSPELAARARELVPDVEVLFTSGYAEDTVVHRGRLDPGVHLLTKPYPRELLARKLRQLLGQRAQRIAARAANAEPRESSEGSAPLRVLFVEDDQDTRELVAAMLSQLGYEVHTAESAEQAPPMLEDTAIDVLLTDQSLPGRSGTMLAMAARQKDPTLGIVIASGYGAGALASELDDLAGAVLLPKPYDVTQLRRALGRAARRD